MMTRHTREQYAESNTTFLPNGRAWQEPEDFVECPSCREEIESSVAGFTPIITAPIGPLSKRLKWLRSEDFVTCFPIKVECRSSQEKPESPTAALTPTIGPKTSGERTIKQVERQEGVETGIPDVHQSNTTPASFRHLLPIAPARGMPTNVPNETNAGFESIKRVDSQDSEELCTKTIHIHLDKDRADLTEPCRALLDTGSDYDLVSEETLRNMRLSFARSKVPPLRGLGGYPIEPIGSVLLKWHMDRRKQTTYCRVFLVISDETPARFDVLIGKPWIVEHKALLRNPEVMLVRQSGRHRSLVTMSGIDGNLEDHTPGGPSGDQ